MKKFGNVLCGIVFITIGVIWALNALDIAHINIFFDGWWTLFIIVPCFIGLFTEDEKTGNVIGLVIGIVLLLACQDILAFNLIWKLLVPMILVIIGLSFIFRDAFNKVVKSEIKKLNKKKAEKEYWATFGSQDVNLDGEVFEGCDLTAVFGGIKLDLREATIKEDCVINATSIFGGIEILAPKNVNIKVSSTPIFGGVENHIKNRQKECEHTLYISATSIFGGTELK